MELAKCFAHILMTMLFLELGLHPISSAPTATSSSSSSTAGDITDSCYTDISTSSEWFQSSGAWESPCSPSGSSSEGDDADFDDWWATFFSSPSLDSLASDALATLREGQDMAETLKKEILTLNIHGNQAVADYLDNKTLIPGAGIRGNTTSTIQMMQEQHSKISTALVYLEQCRHDEEPLCGRTRNLLSFYDDLTQKLLSCLCKITEMFESLQAPAPTPVLRNVMPETDRKLLGVPEAERKRNYRDYVVASDVGRILSEAVRVFRDIDRSSQ